jgi:hypothetical protein
MHVRPSALVLQAGAPVSGLQPEVRCLPGLSRHRCHGQPSMRCRSSRSVHRLMERACPRKGPRRRVEECDQFMSRD